MNDAETPIWDTERERLQAELQKAATALLRHSGAAVVKLPLKDLGDGYWCYIGLGDEVVKLVEGAR